MIDQDSSLPENISIREALSRRLFDYKKTWIKKRKGWFLAAVKDLNDKIGSRKQNYNTNPLPKKKKSQKKKKK